MKKIYKASTGYLIAVVFIGGVCGVYGYHSVHSTTPHDFVLPHDNFSKQTMDAIRTVLAQYNVGGTSQDHEVYMITGGLGIANPRLMSWDANGNMSFGGNQGDGWIYTFQPLSLRQIGTLSRKARE